MRKLLLLFLFYIASSVTAQDIDADTLRKELFGAYGFCAGQKLSLQRIKEELPTLQTEVLKAELEFDSSFGSSCRFVGEFFSSDVKSELEMKAKQFSANTVLTESIATDFIRKVKARAKGEIESPWLETLLAFHPAYEDNPSLEFSRGFKKKFSTSGHVKAKGISIELNVPTSWKAREGNRPNIIQFFKSKNGWGEASFMIQIREVPLPRGVKITQRDIDSMFSSKGLRDLVSDADTVLESKPIVLEGEKGGMWVYEQTVERLEARITMRTLQYAVYYKNRIIFLQFVCGGTEDKRAEWVAEFAKHRPLFQQVANSLIISDKYK